MLELRPILHPGQSEGLVHFTGRSRPSFAPEVEFLTPEERLDNIVREGSLRGHGVPGADPPVVCLSESNRRGAAALLADGGFAAWGVVLSRQWVWDQGGGPVWYVRDDRWSQTRSSLAPELHSWLVRTDPQTSDWLHEREWRIPCPDGQLDLEREGIKAFLVDDPRWEPPTRSEHIIDPGTGRMAVGEVTPDWTIGIPVWHWTGTELVEIDPVGRREEAWPAQP